MSTETRAVVYFSKDGTTKRGAELLAEKLGISKIIPLKLVKQRRGMLGFIINGYKATRKASEKIDTSCFTQIADSKQIYLLTPIWASSSTPAVNGFLDRADLTGRTVTIITFQADPDAGNSSRVFSYLRSRVEAGGGSVEKCIALHGTSPGKYAGDRHIAGQIDKALSQLL